MRTGPQMRIYTEDDVRTALATLESRAPGADAVLDTVRNAARRSQPSLRRPRLVRPRLVIAIATAATAAGLAFALLLPGGAPWSSGGSAPAAATRAALPSAASVGQAMLTAFSTANDHILYSTETGIKGGVVVDLYQDWSWPAQPVPGQQERWREAFSQRVAPAKSLTLNEDDGALYTVPPASAGNVYGQLTVVCYTGTGPSCGDGNTSTPAGTWALYHGPFSSPDPGLDDLSPTALAQGIAHGIWRVTGRTQVDGQQAIELSENPASWAYRPLPGRLWVNAQTYLPLRMSVGAGSSVTWYDWYYLKATEANLALLRVPIPAGYPRDGAAASGNAG